MNVEKLHNKKEQADLEAKVSEAKSAVDAGTASAREQADLKLLPYKGLRFHCKEFSDLEFVFVLVDGAVTALKQTDPSGVSTLTRQ